MTPKKILVPVDGSKGSIESIELAKEISLKFDSIIILLTVAEINIQSSMHEFYSYDPLIEESLEKRSHAILEDMSKLISDIPHEKVLLKGRAGDQILNYCDENPVDLIIMATSGLSSGIRRFLIGSVANYVLHHSKVPVLSIPVDH